jgi:hypothetical protein
MGLAGQLNVDFAVVFPRALFDRAEAMVYATSLSPAAPSA